MYEKGAVLWRETDDVLKQRALANEVSESLSMQKQLSSSCPVLELRYPLCSQPQPGIIKAIRDLGFALIQDSKKGCLEMYNYKITSNALICFGEEGSTGTGN